MSKFETWRFFDSLREVTRDLRQRKWLTRDVRIIYKSPHRHLCARWRIRTYLCTPALYAACPHTYIGHISRKAKYPEWSCLFKSTRYPIVPYFLKLNAKLSRMDVKEMEKNFIIEWGIQVLISTCHEELYKVLKIHRCKAIKYPWKIMKIGHFHRSSNSSVKDCGWRNVLRFSFPRRVFQSCF